jgi:hypothetical protein
MMGHAQASLGIEAGPPACDSKAAKCILAEVLEGIICIVNSVLVSEESLVASLFFLLLMLRFSRMIIHNEDLGGRVSVNFNSL